MVPKKMCLSTHIRGSSLIFELLQCSHADFRKVDLRSSLPGELDRNSYGVSWYSMTRTSANVESRCRLTSQHALALAYRANGQVVEAVEMLEHVVEVKKVQPENHPSRLASQHALAGAYLANGQGKEAMRLPGHSV
jgi:hypothetical protein